MKPELLILKNIGPFIGEHSIDFTILDSIFLVCGKTGAGKTTIFDAITYAFFGSPLGSRSNIQINNLRSQFVDDSENAEVELTFTVGIQRYKILRRLPVQKKNRKNPTPEEVQLAEWKDDQWLDLTAKKSIVDEKIISIIKLTGKEFSKIVVLPQGEFAAFLKDNSNNKSAILKKLFPITKYSEIMQQAKDIQKENEVKIAALNEQLKSLKLKFDDTTYLSQKDKLEYELNFSKNNCSTYLKKINEKIIEKEQAENLKKQLIEYQNTKQELNNINLQEKEITEYKAKIEKAHRANSLKGQAELITELKKSIIENSTAINSKLKELSEIKNILQELKSEEPLINQIKNKNEKLKLALPNVERAINIHRIIEDKTAELKVKQKESNKLETSLLQVKNIIQQNQLEIQNLENDIEKLDEYYKRNNELNKQLNYLKAILKIATSKEKSTEYYERHKKAAESSQNDLEQITKDYEIEKSEFTELKKQREQEELNQKAASLAYKLDEDEPCPVCGSTHHPKLATSTGIDIFTLAEKIDKSERAIENYLKQKEKENKNYTELKKDVERYHEEIENADAQFIQLNEELKSEPFIILQSASSIQIKGELERTADKLNDMQSKLHVAQIANTKKANIEKELATQQIKKEDLNSSLIDITIQINSLQTSIKENKVNYDDATKTIPQEFVNENIENIVDILNSTILEYDLKINNYAANIEENKSKYDKIETSIEHFNTEIQKLESKFETENSQLMNELSKKGFASVDELISSILNEDEIKNYEDDVKNFNEKKIALLQKEKTLNEDLENKKIIEPEVIMQEINTLQKNIDEEQARVDDYIQELTLLNSDYEKHKSLTCEIIKMNEDHQLMNELANELNGSNKLNLKFDTWMLSAFLREIIIYANRRLMRISDERYILKISNDVSGRANSGLDLEIYDAYTGGLRSTATLSGGETFLVSISLALGLADSIQNRNGGIKLDSMFIDEGFGSLDEASLENAISILDEIRDNRLVGIISHVNELKTRIPKKIEIEKTSHGSSIKIIN